eukprot:TRINITY_DN3780_c0_g2_i1.p1 TRINITY_DN3780_c0_g2~~TRINITY_DN3780_c0_g2_i1.p1  ORF type:complete len:245 (+),score=49.96 TRINITY_DN3780_c0_g2_i1:135-869(+)
MSRNGKLIFGFLNLLKPKDLTSADVCNIVKKTLGKGLNHKKIKIGHGGTLDKFAQGVLVVGVGKYCKRLSEFLKCDKIYKAQIRVGEETDTLDPDGQVVLKKSYEHITKEKLQNIIREKYIGEIYQRPPAYSALKYKGKTMSDIIRSKELSKEKVEKLIKPRKLHIYDITIDRFELPNVEIGVHCSSGTYIRKLAKDIFDDLDSCAYLTNLVRIKQKNFTINKALPQSEWNLEKLITNLIKEEN